MVRDVRDGRVARTFPATVIKERDPKNQDEREMSIFVNEDFSSGRMLLEDWRIKNSLASVYDSRAAEAHTMTGCSRLMGFQAWICQYRVISVRGAHGNLAI